MISEHSETLSECERQLLEDFIYMWIRNIKTNRLTQPNKKYRGSQVAWGERGGRKSSKFDHVNDSRILVSERRDIYSLRDKTDFQKIKWFDKTVINQCRFIFKKLPKKFFMWVQLFCTFVAVCESSNCFMKWFLVLWIYSLKSLYLISNLTESPTSNVPLLSFCCCFR